MESSLRQRGVTSEEVMSLLEAEFNDAESEYQHGRLETHPDEIASEPEENSDEQKDGEEESGYITEGGLVKIKSSFEDRTEQVKVDDFLSESCGCKLGPHHIACSSVVSKVAIVQTRNICLQMTRVELDLVIMAQINALRTQASDQPPSQHGHGGFRPHMQFYFHGMQVYKKVFLFLYAISTKRFKNLCASVSKLGAHDWRHDRAVASTVTVFRPKGEVRRASVASEKKWPLIELNTSVSQEGVCIIVAPFVASPCLLVILVAMLAQWTIERENT